MSYVRTKEHREMRARMIHEWKPWEKSTGPKTEGGKKKSAKRGFKGGIRSQQRMMLKLLKQYSQNLSQI